MFFSSGLKIVKSLINKGRHNTVSIPLQHFYITYYYSKNRVYSLLYHNIEYIAYFIITLKCEK